MPRVVCVYFPYLPTDRIRRHGEGTVPADQPLVVISKSGSKRWVSAADTAARILGLKVGMPASKAQAVVSNLTMIDADPAADAAALERLALWALRQYSPVVAVDGTDGIVMDTEGADHLQGGEALLISGLVNGLRGRGLTARAAVADTWGAAHAITRLTSAETTVVSLGGVAKAVTRLPIHCLRLAPDTIHGLRVMGVETVGELSAMPRAPLTLRYGPEVGRRLDQLFGRMAEPIEPLRTPELVEVAKNFQEPIGAAETIAKYVRRLVGELTSNWRHAVLASDVPILSSTASTTRGSAFEPGWQNRSETPRVCQSSSVIASKRSTRASGSNGSCLLPSWQSPWKSGRSHPPSSRSRWSMSHLS